MSATQIRSITAQEVYSDRMKAAVMVTVITENGAVGKAVYNAGTSCLDCNWEQSLWL